MDRTTRALAVTLLVILHLGTGYLHRIAHRELHVWLDDWQRTFVIFVIGLAPVLAASLAWTPLRRIGYVLLSLSMLAALGFGVYFHFIADTPDNVRFLPALDYSGVFTATAIALAVLEALGCWLGVFFLLRSRRRPAAA